MSGSSIVLRRPAAASANDGEPVITPRQQAMIRARQAKADKRAKTDPSVVNVPFQNIQVAAACIPGCAEMLGIAKPRGFKDMESVCRLAVSPASGGRHEWFPSRTVST
jgi:hypothetical protein